MDEPKKPPKRPPANISIGNAAITVYYKTDNRTVDYEEITHYNSDGSIKDIQVRKSKDK